jgi:2,3-bisphosphoglycerate-independent phosphoglycerate mutase
LAFLLITGAYAQQPSAKVDIVQIYVNFVASRVAALGCDAQDKATEVKFLSNLQTVETRALMALKERNGNISEGELSVKIKALLQFTQDAVKAEIANNSCASVRIRELLKLYKLHSEMSLGR